jgi:hypothetical protein
LKRTDRATSRAAKPSQDREREAVAGSVWLVSATTFDPAGADGSSSTTQRTAPPRPVRATKKPEGGAPTGAPSKPTAPAAGEIRFDMAEAEITHEGDRCTSEVLLDLAGLEGDHALAAVAEIVHDIDLKDSRFGRLEADGVRALIAGLCAAAAHDEDRLTLGAAMLDNLHRYFTRPSRSL